MRKFYLPILLLVSLVAVLGIVRFSWLAMVPPLADAHFGEFPNKLQERLLLPEFKTKELNRVVTYASDNVTKVKAEVEFEDGTSGYMNYRPDGTISTFGTFYPEGEDGIKPLKMEAEFDYDGTHYLFEKHYAENGALVRTGRRLASGNYQVEKYLEDGIQIAGRYVYDTDGEAYGTVEFYDNGVTKKLVKVDKLNGTETTLFSEAGLKTSYHSENGKAIVWETFQADGTTPVIRFEQKVESSMYSTSYYILASYYNDDGTLNHERKFSRYYMYAYFKDADGKVVYRQQWKHKQGSAEVTSLESDQWVLEAILHGAEGQYSEPMFFIRPDGTVERYVYPAFEGMSDSPLVIKVYHPDGSLAQWRRPDPNKSGEFIDEKYAPGENPERFDMGLLKNYQAPVPYTVPPQIPPEPESYEH